MITTTIIARPLYTKSKRFIQFLKELNPQGSITAPSTHTARRAWNAPEASFICKHLPAGKLEEEQRDAIGKPPTKSFANSKQEQ